MRIYVAGPYTKGDVAINVRNAIMIGDRLLSQCFTPFIPHLTHFWHLLKPRDYQVWIDYDLKMLEGCEALYRMSGVSPGADGEVDRAKELGIPVFYADDNGMQKLSDYRNNKC
ncbi:hypothetical protein LCGC14_2157470 [marine sediment metagenome]|uniref:DUF7768 domain-containing protein n=1 Tax=marine sediment metagenome TaxID=412755 RepID=A0A0F9G6M6_9ZZZZ